MQRHQAAAESRERACQAGRVFPRGRRYCGNARRTRIIDTGKLEATGEIPIGAGQKPMGMAMSHDGARLYVTTGRGGKVAVIDTAAGKVTESFDGGQRPWGIALSPDEKLLFISQRALPTTSP